MVNGEASVGGEWGPTVRFLYNFPHVKPAAVTAKADERRREERGYETARQIVERQRPAVKVLAEELLEVESVDADLFSDNLLEDVAIEREVGDDLLQLGVFVAQ